MYVLYCNKQNKSRTDKQHLKKIKMCIIRIREESKIQPYQAVAYYANFSFSLLFEYKSMSQSKKRNKSNPNLSQNYCYFNALKMFLKMQLIQSDELIKLALSRPFPFNLANDRRCKILLNKVTFESVEQFTFFPLYLRNRNRSNRNS